MTDRARLGNLNTERLAGAPLGPAHFDDIRRLFTDPRVMATLGGVRDDDTIRAYLKKAQTGWREQFDLWHLRERTSGAFVGRGGLRPTPVEGVLEVEVGWAFLPAFWGRGYATELGRAAIALGFERLGLPSIISFTLPTNAASRRVMEKCGLTYERDGPWADLPHVFYRITAEAWRARQ